MPTIIIYGHSHALHEDDLCQFNALSQHSIEEAAQSYVQIHKEYLWAFHLLQAPLPADYLGRHKAKRPRCRKIGDRERLARLHETEVDPTINNLDYSKGIYSCGELVHQLDKLFICR